MNTRKSFVAAPKRTVGLWPRTQPDREEGESALHGGQRVHTRFAKSGSNMSGAVEDRKHLASLVRAAQEGDDSSFAGLVASYQDVAVAYAASILRDYYLAEDAAQEAFVDAHRQLKSLREPSAFGAWLRTIIFKHCDRIRRRKQRIISGLDAASEPASPSRSPHESLESRETDRLLWEAVASLSDAEQTVVLLYYFGEHSHSAIAEFLGVTANTVKTRLYSARRRLRDMMTDRLARRLTAKRPSGDQLFARRVMTAALSLQIYHVGRSGGKQKAGSTVAARSTEVPATQTWLVEPCESVGEKDWDKILRLMSEMNIPGLGAKRQATDSLLGRISKLTRLKYLDLSGSPITDDGLRHLARLDQLEHLNLSCTQISDKGLSVLQHLPLLRTLELYHQQRITDAGISSLTGCGQLEHVNLMGTQTGDGAIKSLTGKPRLHHFFAGTLITDAGVALFHEFPVFKRWRGGRATMSLMHFTAEPNYLWLNLNAPITNAGLSGLVGLEGLYALNLFGTTGRAPFDDAGSSVTAAALPALAELPRLAWLGCNSQLCTDEAMLYVGAMPRLRFLMCQDAVAGDAGFAALSRSGTIEYIWGRRCHKLTGRGFTSLSVMPALRGLSVSCKNVGDDGLTALPTFPALREFMSVDVTDGGFRHVGRCERLEALYCMYCRDTTDIATGHISGLKKLKTYQAWSTRITDHSLELLGRNRSLEDTGFYGCSGITDAGMAHLGQLPKLRSVNLERLPNVTPQSAIFFPPSVRVNYSA